MSKNKDETKVSIHLNGLNKELELSKVTQVDLKKGGNKFIYLDQLKDGTWRLCYTKETISDIKKLQALTIIRENKQI